jgi:hypothetical protein
VRVATGGPIRRERHVRRRCVHETRPCSPLRMPSSFVGRGSRVSVAALCLAYLLHAGASGAVLGQRTLMVGPSDRSPRPRPGRRTFGFPWRRTIPRRRCSWLPTSPFVCQWIYAWALRRSATGRVVRPIHRFDPICRHSAPHLPPGPTKVASLLSHSSPGAYGAGPRSHHDASDDGARQLRPTITAQQQPWATASATVSARACATICSTRVKDQGALDGSVNSVAGIVTGDQAHDDHRAARNVRERRHTPCES